MTGPPLNDPDADEPDQRDERLSAAIEEYYRRLETDSACDRQTFLQEFADVAAELNDFFSTLDDVDRLAHKDRRAPAEPSEIRLTQVASAPSNALLGTVRYFGDYELLEEIARGGMGVVYRARQVSLGRIVAVKMILAGLLATEADVARFRHEATAAAQLQHPNVVTIFEIGEHQGQHFFSMEYVPGVNLAQLVREHPLAASVAAEHARTIAGAIAAIHAVDLLHRDLKPSNVLVDRRTGILRVSDFGLAKNTAAETLATTTGEVLGTPSYMSPEQAAGRNDDVGPASDVYSIGAILYELITGRPPFKGETPWDTAWQVQHAEVVAPTALNHRVPRDLETICLKCLQKEVVRRYRTAQELADDLGRFVRQEPILARPISQVERAWRWCARNKGWAAFLGGLALSGAIAVGSVIAIQTQGAAAARERATLAEKSQSQQTRDARLQAAQRIRLSPHVAGWSAESWQLVNEAAQLGADPAAKREARNQAAATLGGLDAVLLHEHVGFGTSYVRFARTGEELLLSGWEKSPARRWDAKAKTLTTPERGSAGPVGYDADGHPLQVIQDADSKTLLLWNINEARPQQRFALPDNAQADLAVAALAEDAAHFACVIRSPEGKPASAEIALWSGATGELERRWDFAATALAFSADNQWLAAGNEQGRVTVWNVATGAEQATLAVGRTEIQSLAFGVGPATRAQLSERFPQSARQPLLACGAAGGSISIWNLSSRELATHCHGAQFEVHALQFSPDGTLLASGDRDRARLWDVTTGQSLLALAHRNWMTSVAFSADGQQLAVGQLPLFGYQGGLDIWQVQRGRGIQTLRGLSSPIARVCWSPSNRLLAAISHDWQVAVWQVEGGALRAVVNMPAGLTADNAAVAIDFGDQKLAYSTGKNAELWDLKSGKSLHSWPLPLGLVDQLTFDEAGKLWSVRSETSDRIAGPYSEFPPDKYPRVIRRRELLAGSEAGSKEIELTDFNRHVFGIALAPDATRFVVEGIAGTENKQRLIRGFDLLTGKPQWTRAAKYRTSSSHLMFASAGNLLSLGTDDSLNLEIVDAATGQMQQSVLLPLRAIGPQAQLVFCGEPAGLQAPKADQPLVNLGLGSGPITSPGQFDGTGRLIAWGNVDGTVSIVDIAEVNRELKRIGLEW